MSNINLPQGTLNPNSGNMSSNRLRAAAVYNTALASACGRIGPQGPPGGTGPTGPMDRRDPQENEDCKDCKESRALPDHRVDREIKET